MSNQVEIPPAVGDFRRRKLITHVFQPPLRSGKEATVYRCAAHPATGHRWLALKTYRLIEQRAFRNDAAYRQGRFSGSTRVDRAIAAGSRFGLEMAQAQWLGAERQTLARLHQAGADVPLPVAAAERSLLMEFIGDESPAPLLHETRLPVEALADCWRRLLRTVRIALDRDRVHGDLSPYNVLWWRDRPVVIDWPQAVDPRCNDAAEGLLRRDLLNLGRWFTRRGLAIDGEAVADELWRTWLAGERLHGEEA